MTEDDKELKTKFAEALLRTPDKPFEAALSVIPDTGKALQIATLWVDDTFVREEKIRLLSEHDPKEFLPSKAQVLQLTYKMAEDEHLDEETRLKAIRLYAEINGMIERNPAANITVGVQTVMVVKDKGGDAEWEANAVAQQRKLIQGDNAQVN